MRTAHPAATTQIVPTAGMAVASGCSAILETYSLGSCLGVVFYDALASVGGMLHSMLPGNAQTQAADSSIPCCYTNSGLDALLAVVLAAGAQRERLAVYAAGAAQLLGNSPMFSVGKRNEMVLRQWLARARFVLAGRDLGGNQARSLRLSLATGEVVSSVAGEERLLSPASDKALPAANCDLSRYD